MKSFVYILLSVCILAQASSKSILLLHYRLNKEAIAARYCINKSKPEKNCAGSCQLHKNLKDTKEAPIPFGGSTKETTGTTLFCQALTCISFNLFPAYSAHLSHYLEFKLFAFKAKFLHPPN
ncbi:hypothetical protein [Adhaeribacter rhizoryzae]|uniref:Uncharacterized protein n=1 Tax=Adhaeribacter rhizoryzae TaxID=2607907 RepID=A0A5M6CXP1_9BACT|nr:hypothetical protein [Adhaeribacter rhizoryzae]KAA5539984.1 hypothetical protein F0145_23640 [Adhaeribacter rhizoryzae]